MSDSNCKYYGVRVHRKGKHRQEIIYCEKCIYCNTKQCSNITLCRERMHKLFPMTYKKTGGVYKRHPKKYIM